MDRFIVQGGTRLKGEVRVSGAKNAALPMMAATLLTPGVFRLRNVPDLVDVKTMAHVLRVLGARIEREDRALVIDTTGSNYHEAPYEDRKSVV